MSHPLFSIGIPNYNYGRFLKQCLDSVFNQTFGDFEVIVSENASSDNSLDVLASYKDSRLKVVHQQQTIPVYDNFNASLAPAKGRFLKILPSDDILFPEYLMKAKEAIDIFPEVGFLMMPIVSFTDESEIKDYHVIASQGKWKVCNASEVLRLSQILSANLVMPVSNLFRADLYRRFGDYSATIGSADFLLFCDMSLSTSMVVYSTPLAGERIHAAQGRRTSDYAIQSFQDRIVGFDKLLSSGQINKKETQHLQRQKQNLCGHFICYGFKHSLTGDLEIARNTYKAFAKNRLLRSPGYLLYSTLVFLASRIMKSTNKDPRDKLMR